ncbi:hypothetical protein CF328_g4332 [Tilletia controversa]|nr:hypothetical protein CF328_g4332 [Tilletia controversa]
MAILCSPWFTVIASPSAFAIPPSCACLPQHPSRADVALDTPTGVTPSLPRRLQIPAYDYWRASGSGTAHVPAHIPDPGPVAAVDAATFLTAVASVPATHALAERGLLRGLLKPVAAPPTAACPSRFHHHRRPALLRPVTTPSPPRMSVCKSISYPPMRPAPERFPWLDRA